MGKRVLVLSGSPRKHGNSDRLADQFIRGALAAGNEVEKIYISDKRINGCLGCGACQKNGGKCIQRDDMQELYQKILAADVVVLASPVYFYSWTSQIKAVIDRTFAIERQVENKKFYLICSAAAPSEEYMQVILESFCKYIGCFRAGGNSEGGYVFGLNTNAPADVERTHAMQQAYEMGALI